MRERIRFRPFWFPCLLVCTLCVAACSSDPSSGDGAAPTVEPESATTAAASPDDWCAGHGLPESMCTICNPELTAGFKAAGDWCAEHGLPESACPLCADEPPAIAPNTRVRFEAPETEGIVGIEFVVAHVAPLDTDIECTARITFDRNRLADVRAPLPGVVRDVAIDLGERVARGDELFVLASAEVGRLQGDLRSARGRHDVARANYERHLELSRAQIASARDVELVNQQLQVAQAELEAAEVALRIAGAGEADAEGRFHVRSPIAGSVVRRPATVGTFATEEVSLATIADTSTMWALLEVREADATLLRVGQQVTIRLEGVGESRFTGTLTWIASEVDVRTRTVTARAEVDNGAGLLRAEQFARGTIRVAEEQDAVVVPRQSVQRFGESFVVFVRTREGMYEPREVKVGRSAGELVQVVGDVGDGDWIVTEGAYLLKTELSRDSIGAGCCEVAPAGTR